MLFKQNEELALCTEQQKALDDGEAHEDIPRETPRRRDERNLFWSDIKRRERRRVEREKAYHAIHVREQVADKKLGKNHRLAHKRGRLPELHLDMLRQPHIGHGSPTFTNQLGKGINQGGAHKFTALHLAVLQQSKAVLSEVLAHEGCNPDVQDAAGYTALHHALCLGHAGFDLARMLVDAGADMTVRNREGLNPIQVALSLQLYNEIAHFLESFSTWDIACVLARRFFKDYFAGDPIYHHYKTITYEHSILIAYVVVMHPNVLRGGLQMRLKVRQMLGKERTMNNLERFFHDIKGNQIYDSTKNDRFSYRTPLKVKPKDVSVKKQLKQVRKDLEAREALRRGATLKDLQTEGGKVGVEDEEDDSEDERDEVNRIPYGVFCEFKRKTVKRWYSKALLWNFFRNADRIAKYAFQGRLSSAEVTSKLQEGRDIFTKWREENKKTLLEDEERRLREVADAVRLRKLRKEREAKLEQQRIEEERLRRERAKKGLDKMDPDACVILSAGDVDFYIDENTSAGYTIQLGTRPLAPVLVKLSIQPAPAVDDEGDSAAAIAIGKDSQFTIRPSLITFTPKNWDEPREVVVEIKDDDALVRMKRRVAQGPTGVCNHRIIHVIPNCTDWSYKHPDLKWTPIQNPILQVM